MAHTNEYVMLQDYIKISPKQLQYGSDTETFRLPVADEICKRIDALPKRIHTTALGKDYEVKSHSLCFAPDGRTLILSILLQHSPTHASNR